MYTVFVILHIACAGIWFSLGIANMLLMGQAAKAKGTIGELVVMRSQAILGTKMGMVGAIGILITGGAMVGIQSLGWLPFGTTNWLALKQTIWIILFVIAMAIMMPRGKKIEKMLAEEMAGPNAQKGASDALRRAMGTLKSVGILMNLLVLTNMVLGEWKPNF